MEDIKLNEYLDIISYECNKKIIEQMENDICKIINKNNMLKCAEIFFFKLKK